jgi:hypothetical protein
MAMMMKWVRSGEREFGNGRDLVVAGWPPRGPRPEPQARGARGASPRSARPGDRLPVQRRVARPATYSRAISDNDAAPGAAPWHWHCSLPGWVLPGGRRRPTGPAPGGPNLGPRPSESEASGFGNPGPRRTPF